MRWCVYIAECKNGSLYTGATNHLARRLQEHAKRTTHYTSYNPIVRIVHTERFGTQSAAFKREAEVKRWPRAKKLALINGGLVA